MLHAHCLFRLIPLHLFLSFLIPLAFWSQLFYRAIPRIPSAYRLVRCTQAATRAHIDVIISNTLSFALIRHLHVKKVIILAVMSWSCDAMSRPAVPRKATVRVVDRRCITAHFDLHWLARGINHTLQTIIHAADSAGLGRLPYASTYTYGKSWGKQVQGSFSSRGKRQKDRGITPAGFLDRFSPACSLAQPRPVQLSLFTFSRSRANMRMRPLSNFHTLDLLLLLQ